MTMTELKDTGFVIFPKCFKAFGVEVQVLTGEGKAREIGAYEINGDDVFYTVYLPCIVTKVSGKKGQEDDTEAEQLEYPFLMYKRNPLVAKERGVKFINPGTRLVTIGDNKYRMRGVMNYPWAMDTTDLTWFENDTPIDPEKLYQLVRGYVKRRIDFEPSTKYDLYDITSTWAIATHFHQAFDNFPFIKYEGPPGCGKTTANWTIACISFHPILTPDVSDAGFYRIRESVNGTVALDERDFQKQFQNTRFDDFLNNSFSRGGSVVRIDKDTNGNLIPVFFRVFGPFSFSGVQDLPNMTETRTLVISMKKSLLQAYSGTMPQVTDPEPLAIRNLLLQARFAVGIKVAQIYREMNVQDYPLDARAWDMARPLIAVAKVFAPQAVNSIVAYINDQVKERTEDVQQRDEIKVLLSLESLLNKRKVEGGKTGEFWLGIKAIREELLIIFSDENSGFWTERLIGSKLRMLSFRQKKRDNAGRFIFRFTENAIVDWITRLKLHTNSEAERSEHINTMSHSEHSDVQKEGQLSLEASQSKTGNGSEHSDIQTQVQNSSQETERPNVLNQYCGIHSKGVEGGGVCETRNQLDIRNQPIGQAGQVDTIPMADRHSSDEISDDSEHSRAFRKICSVKGAMSDDYAVEQLTKITGNPMLARAYFAKFCENGRLRQGPDGYWRVVI